MVSHIETHRYPYNFIYKVVPVTGSIYPKIRNLTLKLLIKSKIFSFSYNFDYICSCETSLSLIVMSIFIYNIHHSQLCEISQTLVIMYSMIYLE